MSKPKLTIDFNGLWAFVADHRDPAKVTRLHAATVGADPDTKKTGICRHDPIVVFRLQQDFLSAGDDRRDQHSVHTVDGEDLGFWNVRGKSLEIQGVDAAAAKLRLTPSYGELLSIDKLHSNGGILHQKMSQPGKNGVGALLDIRHGVVSAHGSTDDKWGVAPKKGTPTDYFYFRQIVRWRVVAPMEPKARSVRLAAGPNEWIQFQRGAHIVVSALCAFAPGIPKVAEDVLGFYPLCEKPPTSGTENVLHRKAQSTPVGGTFVRPAVDACPPATGYLA